MSGDQVHATKDIEWQEHTTGDTSPAQLPSRGKAGQEQGQQQHVPFTLSGWKSCGASRMSAMKGLRRISSLLHSTCTAYSPAS